jgi:hypothetical protein
LRERYSNFVVEVLSHSGKLMNTYDIYVYAKSFGMLSIFNNPNENFIHKLDEGVFDSLLKGRIGFLKLGGLNYYYVDENKADIFNRSYDIKISFKELIVTILNRVEGNLTVKEITEFAVENGLTAYMNNIDEIMLYSGISGNIDKVYSFGFINREKVSGEYVYGLLDKETSWKLRDLVIRVVELEDKKLTSKQVCEKAVELGWVDNLKSNDVNSNSISSALLFACRDEYIRREKIGNFYHYFSIK